MNNMMATVHIYYTVELSADGGGFTPMYTTLATFEHKHEALEYITAYKRENPILWGTLEIHEHIER